MSPGRIRARRYDYWLGGKDNFAADQIAEAFPAIRTAVRENRRFLARAVSYLAGSAGIRQFLDCRRDRAERLHDMKSERSLLLISATRVPAREARSTT